MRPKPKIKDGWKMTEGQYNLYWRLVRQAHHAYNSQHQEKLSQDAVRSLIHARAFGRNISAKEIDRMSMFGDFKSACMAIIAPNSVNAQLAIARANDPRTLLIHRILEFPVPYILGLMNSPRFAHCESTILEDLEQWTEKDLTDLRNTLCARNPISSSRAGQDKTCESARYAGTTEHPGKCVSVQSDRDDEAQAFMHCPKCGNTGRYHGIEQNDDEDAWIEFFCDDCGSICENIEPSGFEPGVPLDEDDVPF